MSNCWISLPSSSSWIVEALSCSVPTLSAGDNKDVPGKSKKKKNKRCDLDNIVYERAQYSKAIKDGTGKLVQEFFQRDDISRTTSFKHPTYFKNNQNTAASCYDNTWRVLLLAWLAQACLTTHVLWHHVAWSCSWPGCLVGLCSTADCYDNTLSQSRGFIYRSEGQRDTETAWLTSNSQHSSRKRWAYRPTYVM